MQVKIEANSDRPFFGMYWPEGVPHALEFDDNLTLPLLMEQAVEIFSDDPLIWFLGDFLTYRQFKTKVDQLATKFDHLGISKGDVVALHLPNCSQYVIGYYAVLKLGAIVAGINPTYKTEEIVHQLKIVGAKAVIVLDSLFTAFYSNVLKEWNFEHIIITNLNDNSEKTQRIPDYLVNFPITGNILDYKDCFPQEISIPIVKMDPKLDTAVLLMTGGTTGVPKAAELTHYNLVANAYQTAYVLHKSIDPITGIATGKGTGHLGCIPLYHSFAMTLVMNVCFTVGAWMVLFPKPPPPEQILEYITSLPDYNGFVYSAAPILFQRIAELPQEIIDKYPIKGKLRQCIAGAVPLYAHIKREFEQKTGAKLTEGYGLSEASPLVCINSFYGPEIDGKIGVPVPGTDWQLFDAENFDNGPIYETDPEHTGEICVSGPQVMKGYWNNLEKSENVIREWNGRRWLLTGDIAWMDEYGNMEICDRKKQLIKLAGNSIFPKDVETLIGNHPSVREVAVAGLPDPNLGEIVKAWVVLKPNLVSPPNENDLIMWCKDHMAHWKVPKFIEFIDEVPKSSVGKILRRLLQEKDPLWKKAN